MKLLGSGLAGAGDCFSSHLFFGIPLFNRRLNWYGLIFLTLWSVQVIISSIELLVSDDEGLWSSVGFYLVAIGMYVYIGIKGNRLTAISLLENGFELVEPDSEITKRALTIWDLKAR